MPNPHRYLSLLQFNHTTDLNPVGLVAGTGVAGPLYVAVARTASRPTPKTLRNALADLRQQGAFPLLLATAYSKPHPRIIVCLMAERKTAVVLDVSADEAEHICTATLDPRFRPPVLHLLEEATGKPK